MSLGEFFACVDGWNKAHGDEERPSAPSDEWHDQILRDIERQRQDG